MTLKTQVSVTLDEDYAELLVYTQGSGMDENFISGERDSALCAAVRIIGEDKYSLLNNGKPIHYPTSSYAVVPVGSGILKNPYLFRKSDGSYGLIAGNNNKGSKAYLFDSEDLITFQNERLLSLNEASISVQDPFALYDEKIDAYRIRWTDDKGIYYETVTDLKRIFSVSEIEVLNRPVLEGGSLPIVSGLVSNLKLTKTEYERVSRHYSRVINIGVETIPPLTIQSRCSVQPPNKIKALYSDGSFKYLGVQWENEDLLAVRTYSKGTYKIKGTVEQIRYPDPFIKYRADPHITKSNDGYYYFTASYPINGDQDLEGYDRIVLRRSQTLEGLAGTVELNGMAEPGVHEIVIWDEKHSTSNGRYIWAPEIHQINGNWFIFFTASTSKNNLWALHPAVIACKGDGDPFKKENWDTEAHFNIPYTGDNIAFNSFSLDMTYFESGGQHYVAWAQYVEAGPSSILIATINPEQPWILTSKSVILSEPSYAWEKATDGNGMINEGPSVIKRDGTVYLAFSASSVNWSYCIGVLSISEGENLLEVENWVKINYPVLETNDLDNQNGPGHNSFTVDKFGNPIIVYHARTPGEKEGSGNGGLGDPGRHARIKPVHFTEDGSLVFSMTPEEELNPMFKDIYLDLIVKD
ncbi:family 43 glycosylhydrolase [Paenibacillus tundrae]|uniref:GH43 family beta-xylosidase n=1 Tax=Paenibacillus tundrae TaxID=528187 RepID=A0ABT9WEU7_9BACL|nr:family 43 glycosylhydrolase [Paenibacillus tundrae]MDQ0171330.1 GH43 family beta-xylosidase [Paenibacillus tundrae]